MTMIRTTAAAALACATLGVSAHAGTHRDAVELACLRDGHGEEACACAASRYRDELNDQELAFYARMIGRDRSEAFAIAAEIGLDARQTALTAGKLARLETDVRDACGLPVQEND